MQIQKRVLPVIVVAQFFCTSLWFASNGVMADMVQHFQLDSSALGHLTSACQFGFITGTLLFAILTIADRYSPSNVFLVSALLGAAFNVGTIWNGNGAFSLLLFRFFTGFWLAGIYPVGMKIAADYFEKGLGKSLSFLVGALVLGTALPHFLKYATASFPWQSVILTTSGLATMGGGLLFTLVPDGPFRKASQGVDLAAFFKVFQNRTFRSAAFGYFGHMWELYAFWAFVPVILATYDSIHPQAHWNIPLLCFQVISIGSIACFIGGYLSQAIGVRRVAFAALLLSGTCCLLSPLFFTLESSGLFLLFLHFWGMVVIADSPLFSTLVAQNATVQLKGTALTIVNCIGFAITIISILLLNTIQSTIDPSYLYLILGVGPVLGLIALRMK